MPTTPPKRGPGRPPLSPDGRQQKHTVFLYSSESDWLIVKYGNVHAGLRAIVAEAMSRDKK